MEPPPPLILYIRAMECTLNATEPEGRSCTPIAGGVGDLTVTHKRDNGPSNCAIQAVTGPGVTIGTGFYSDVYTIQRDGSCSVSNLRLNPEIEITRDSGQGAATVPTVIHTSCSRALYIGMIAPSYPNSELPVPCPPGTTLDQNCVETAFAYEIVGFANGVSDGGIGIPSDCAK